MALTREEIMDLMVEEKQIVLLLENAVAERDQAKADADQAYVAALTTVSDTYLARTQKADSRLIEIRETLKRDGEWVDTKGIR